ncbi:MAG TPA: SIMPL domain-containing protein [bacterium]|nr:SIMPL domain-containing protein [bacterium]
MKENKVLAALVLGISLIIGLATFGYLYQEAQLKASANDVLSVTGSAKMSVVSDQAKLIINISRIAPISSLAEGYEGIASDLRLAQNLLKQKGVSNDKIIISPVSMYQMYDSYSGAEIRYQLSQSITIQDNDVEKITAISKDIPSLAAQGAIISFQSLEYYYSNLAELRVSLLADAVKDAKARAEKIASGTGRGIGNVQSASSGVVQVLSSNSVDISDYGSYDTSNIDKDIMVTVKASFRLE